MTSKDTEDTIRRRIVFREMTADVRRYNIEKGWRPADGGPGENSFGDYAALLVEEIGEMVSAYRKHRLTDVTGPARCADSRCTNYGSTCLGKGTCPTEHARLPKPEGVGAEMADILIRLISTADAWAIDLEAEYRRKMTHNWTRPRLHGGTMADAKPAAETDPRLATAGGETQRFNALWMTIPDDPREWWTGEEVDAFIEQWERLKLPKLTLQDATGSRLTLWCSDMRYAAALVGMDAAVGDGFEIVKGAYSVGIVQAKP